MYKFAFIQKLLSQWLIFYGGYIVTPFNSFLSMIFTKILIRNTSHTRSHTLHTYNFMQYGFLIDTKKSSALLFKLCDKIN